MEVEKDKEDDTDYSSGDLFLNKTYVQKTLECSGCTINVKMLDTASTDYDLTGQIIWPAAKLLTQYIVSKREEYQNGSILEVGSGVGICGLFVARVNPNSVVSDNNDIVMELLEENAQLSRTDGYPCQAVKLEWGDMANIESVKKQYGTFDTILGADVVYWRTSIIPLFLTIQQLLTDSSSASYILCYQSRSSQTDTYLLEQASLHGFNYEFIDHQSFFNNNNNHTLNLLKSNDNDNNQNGNEGNNNNTNNQQEEEMEKEKETKSNSYSIKDEYLLSIMKLIVFKRKNEDSGDGVGVGVVGVVVE
ncbi:hypothetical protein DFA_10190 [Cavenderia fasciculata]|uniref:Uncharacterized protein n=1 Tax=Cavenderia fasciculata TaxID=261658 RepID=F4Q9I7_CACFS|nr:uncharacterized protein DFA_10190 [Cavenderia fasciculata]EGG15356.1 hypothetical protein DFA_10190 [Cavenderia fasciculata]|eukprot:XP_004354098.1 hypothetical protein DFA_10190 [Cavenderia fasciculata]